MIARRLIPLLLLGLGLTLAAGCARRSDPARAVVPESDRDPASVGELTPGDEHGVTVLCYHYFSDHSVPVRALRAAGAVLLGLPLVNDVGTWTTPVQQFENQLRFLIRRHLDAFQAEPGLCRLVLAEARPDPAFYDQAVLDLNRRYTGLALAVVEAGRRAGELRDDVSPAVIRDLIYGGLEHAVWRHVFGDRDLDAERLADELANALLDGLALRTQATGEETMARLERAVARLENRVEAGEPTPPIPSDRPSGGRP